MDPEIIVPTEVVEANPQLDTAPEQVNAPDIAVQAEPVAEETVEPVNG